MAVKPSRKFAVRNDQLDSRKRKRKVSSKKPIASRLKASKKQTLSRQSVPASDPNGSTRLAVTDLNIPVEDRRPVLCDGENLAYNEIAGTYDANRISEAVQWFRQNGHRTLVLVPDYLPRKLIGSLPDTDVEIVTGGYDEVKNPEENRHFEEALLQKANDTEAAIVSERRFASTYFIYPEVVLSRVIGYTFFRDSIFIPVDPYGRAGPWLNIILRK